MAKEPTLDDILAGRHALLGEAPATFAEDLETTLGALASSLDTLLADLGTDGARFTRDEASLALAENMIPAIIAALDEAGYSAAVERYLDRYPDVVEYVAATHEAVKLDSGFTTISREAAETARRLDLEMFRSIGDRAAGEIRRSIAQAVIYERDFTAFVEDLKLSITGTDVRGAPLANRAQTFALTAVAEFDATVAGLIGDEAGVTHYRYWGPLDSVTRPWCQRRLRDNRPLTRDEIEALAKSTTNAWGGSNFIARGGPNCRHIWTPVPTDELPAEET